MGTDLHIVLVGSPGSPGSSDIDELIESAVRRVQQLELRWSRFDPGSEVSRCNSTRGIPVDVSADTRLLLRHAIHGWEYTTGAYDPTILDSLIASGYDRSYEALTQLADSTGRTSFPEFAPAAAPARATAPAPAPAPGCSGIEIDDEFGTVTLPFDVGFDPGGIGKGLAADMIVEEMIDRGARGAMVNLGGDLRVAGDAPSAAGWIVEINEPAVSRAGQVELAGKAELTGQVELLEMIDGGLATSTTRRRVWTVDGETRHHVIDPRVGRPVESRAQLATVITGRAWWSEVIATHLLLASPDEWSDITRDDAALVVDIDGIVHLFGPMKDHLR